MGTLSTDEKKELEQLRLTNSEMHARLIAMDRALDSMSHALPQMMSAPFLRSGEMLIDGAFEPRALRVDLEGTLWQGPSGSGRAYVLQLWPQREPSMNGPVPLPAGYYRVVVSFHRVLGGPTPK